MSSADIDEIYEELLQIYKARYPDNPRHVLSYKIIELVREGKTRENAILALYEEEGKITRAEAEELGEAIRKKEEKAIEQQIKEHKKSMEKLTLLFSKGELDEESYKAAIKPLEEKIARLEREKKEEEIKSLEERVAKLKREGKEEATVKLRRELAELPVPPPTTPTKRLDLKTISKYFIHGFAFSILFFVMFLAWFFALAILIVSGAIIGLIIGFGLLILIVGYLNSVVTDFLWFAVDQEFWSLLFHGFVLFIILLAINAVSLIPNIVFPSVYVQIITFIVVTFLNGLVGKTVAELWREDIDV